MRNLKKFLALILAMMMTFSLMVTVNASSFKDADDVTDDYVEAVDVLTALNVIKGYENADKTYDFKPKDKITRGEVAAILYRIVTGDVKDSNTYLYKHESVFTDVYATDWYAPYINFCENNGLIKGVGDNRFNPNGNITGYEALVMILRAIGYDNPTEFTSSDWKFKASGYGTKLGLTTNIAAGSLGAAADREVVAEIMFQGIQAPTVSYNMLLGYTNDVLVAATKNSNGWVYDQDVYNTLMFQTFQIVGKRTIYGSDNKYGRPIVEWVKDAKDDTVENGGKYIVNPQAATGKNATADSKGNGAKPTAAGSYKDGINPKAVYVPASTPGANYAFVNGSGAYDYMESKTDQTVLSLTMTPVYTFNTAMTECELTKAINGDESIAWANITEYVNGGLVFNRGTAEAGSMLDALHTTNTGSAGKSDYTIGAQGRQTEVYNLGDVDGDTDDEWVFVYIDTILGEVEKVVPKTVDTAGHTDSPAELHIAVNDTIKGNNAIVMTSETNYTQKKGDKVLLTTWGLKNETQGLAGTNAKKKGDLVTDTPALIGATMTSAIAVNEHILNAVPDDAGRTVSAVANVRDAYQVVTAKANNGGGCTAATDVNVSWAVDLASKTLNENATVPTTTVTVDATLGFSADKTGIIANGKNIYTTWAYHVDQLNPDGTAKTDATHTTTVTDVADDTVLAKHHVVVTNQIIGQTYTAALDKNGNIVGMWQGASDKIIGVVTDVDYARVGLGKYAVEMEVFTTDSKTETVRLLDASNNNSYFPTQEEADDAIVNDSNDKLGTGGMDGATTPAATNINPKGALVELTSYTKDGATYWKVSDKCDATTKLNLKNSSDAQEWMRGDADADGIVMPGKADTLVGTANAATGTNNNGGSHTTVNVTDETVFIVAEYDFRYNTGSGNQGSNINVRYTVYKGFRDIPVITGDQYVNYSALNTTTTDAYNIAFQMLDGKITNSEAGYVLISAFNPNAKYTQSKHSTFNPDDSFLVVAPGATYAAYSEYSVARNGALDTIKVANINNTVNAKLQAAIRTKGLLVATSTNGAGYITDVEEVKGVQGGPTNNPNLGDDKYVDTLIPKGSGLTYSKGVLSYSVDAWSAAGKTGTPVDLVNTTPLTGFGSTKSGTAQAYRLTVAEGCVVKIVNVDAGKLFDATLDNIKQYQATSDIVFELDANGWVSCLYIID